jgi:asparagine N-glycosylation enzyme membrane subunit Stt3
LVGLPGAGAIDTLTGLGTLYLPAALLSGYTLALAQQLGAGLLARLNAPGVGAALVGALLLLVIAANTGRQTQVVTGDTALVVDADMAAMQWIREHTPADARFVINSFPAYGGTLAAGTDAGWWIPLLAHRATTLPPLNYGSEQGERPRYHQDVNALVKKLRGRDLTDSTPLRIDLSRPVALKTLDSNAIDYVYIGAHSYPGRDSADWFDPDKLRASPFFRLVYDQDGVEIFQFLKGAK